MSNTSTSPEVVEVVVITGPRRGEIVRIDLDQHEIWSDEEAALVAAPAEQARAAGVGSTAPPPASAPVSAWGRRTRDEALRR